MPDATRPHAIATPSAAQLCSPDAAGHTRHPQGRALAWPRRYPHHGDLSAHGSFRKTGGRGSGHSAGTAPRTVQGTRRADCLAVGESTSVFRVSEVGQPIVTTKYL